MEPHPLATLPCGTGDRCWPPHRARHTVIWRRQLPAYSPLPFGALMAAWWGLLGDGEEARRSVHAILARRFSASAVILTDSGTGALDLAIRACLAGSAGAVAMPAYACYDLATAADGARAPVLLYDVDPETLAPDLPSLHRTLERGVRAVVLVHLYGIPVDPEPVRAAVRSAGALLIEDAAQGVGASLRGRPLGSLGDLAVFSFGRGKGATAGGGGALLACTDAGAEVAGRLDARLAPSRGVREFVQLGAQWLLGRPSLYAIPASLPFLALGETVYHTASPVRDLSRAGGATLRATWPRVDAEAAVRRRNASRLLAHAGRALKPVALPPGAEAGYLRLPFVADAAARAAAASARARSLGVMPGYPAALRDLDGFGERVGNRGQGFAGAQLLAARLVTLPVHSLLSDRDLAALEAWAAVPGP